MTNRQFIKSVAYIVLLMYCCASCAGWIILGKIDGDKSRMTIAWITCLVVALAVSILSTALTTRDD